MRGVDWKPVALGRWPVLYRLGVASSRASTMVASGADHSPPPGVVMLTCRSTDVHSQASSRSAKLPASIWSSGEYFFPPMSPA